MPDARHLRNAPIVEALLDLRFDVADDATLEEAGPVFDALHDSYPQRTVAPLQGSQADLFGSGSSQQPEARVTLHNSEDLNTSTRVVVLKRDGITVRQVWQYSCWEELEGVMRIAFEAFCKYMKPSAIVRLGTRYFNKIELPAGEFDLNDIFTCAPRLPKNVPHNLFDFSHRIGLIGNPPEILAWIEHYVDRASQEGKVSAILDIDVYRNQRFQPTWQALAEPIDGLHKLKNEIFFGSLTDSALEKYE